MTMPFWVSWLLLGLIAGILAQLLYPKYAPDHLLITTGLGSLGGVAGGWLCELVLGGIGHPLTETIGDYSILLSVVGANMAILMGRRLGRP